MQEECVRALGTRRGEIHARWEALLRIERVNTPLANPDALVFLIDWTLDEIFGALRDTSARRRGAMGADQRPDCPCGRNPLLVYFSAGGQAIEEALVLVQAATPGLAAGERDRAFATLKAVVREISRREIEAFCAICQYRSAACAATAEAHAEVR